MAWYSADELTWCASAESTAVDSPVAANL